MRRMVAGASIALAVAFTGTVSADAAPYVQCPGGYLAKVADECPPVRTPIAIVRGGPPPGGGGNEGGGLLGVIRRVLGGIL